MLIPKEQYVATFNSLPEPVRAFLVAEDFNVRIQKIAEPHKLHVDAIGVLAKATSYMLMGLMSPAQVAEELSLAGIDDTTTQRLLTEINEAIFKPIRQKIQEEKSVEVSQAAQPELNKLTTPPTAPEVRMPQPVREPPRSAPVPIYSPLPASSVPSVPPSRVEPPPNLPGQMPEPAPARPVSPPPHIEVPAPVAAPQPAKEAPVPQQDPHNRIIHTMARDMEAVKSGVDPLRVAHPAPPSWAETPTKPAPVVPPPPVVPPQPQVEHPAPPIAPSVTPPAPAVHEAPHPQEALRTHLKQYGVDPYREPVE